MSWPAVLVVAAADLRGADRRRSVRDLSTQLAHQAGHRCSRSAMSRLPALVGPVAFVEDKKGRILKDRPAAA
jgi:hypothetical protein